MRSLFPSVVGSCFGFLQWAVSLPIGASMANQGCASRESPAVRAAMVLGVDVWRVQSGSRAIGGRRRQLAVLPVPPKVGEGAPTWGQPILRSMPPPPLNPASIPNSTLPDQTATAVCWCNWAFPCEHLVSGLQCVICCGYGDGTKQAKIDRWMVKKHVFVLHRQQILFFMPHHCRSPGNPLDEFNGFMCRAAFHRKC